MAFDIPQITRGVADDYKRLYYSNPEAALKIPITMQAGYGLVKAGTMIARNKSAAGNIGKHVPYNATTYGSTIASAGRAFLVTTASGGTTVEVSLEDSYKFAVGDDLIIEDDNTTAENLGAITAIDRTTYTNKAVITVTATISGSFAAANHAYVAVEAGDSSNTFSDCVGVLEKSVDTGTGSTAKGALSTLIVSNAILYEGMLTYCDAAAKTDISASSVGQYLVIK